MLFLTNGVLLKSVLSKLKAPVATPPRWLISLALVPLQHCWRSSDWQQRVPTPVTNGCGKDTQRFTVYRFDLGFDYEDGGNVVTGVKEGSEAYCAGLRDSQILLATSIWFGRTDKEIELTVP